jgi:hypothetical protein
MFDAIDPGFNPFGSLLIDYLNKEYKTNIEKTPKSTEEIGMVAFEIIGTGLKCLTEMLEAHPEAPQDPLFYIRAKGLKK